MHKILIIVCFFLFSFSKAQIGIGTTTPNPSSVLDISSNNKGLLIPRMTETEKNSISSPANGLLIYQTDGVTGFYYYDGSIWKIIDGSGDNLGNHLATQNIQLNGNWLSGDGDNEGIYVNNLGQVGVGTNNPSLPFHILNMTTGSLTSNISSARIDRRTTSGSPGIGFSTSLVFGLDNSAASLVDASSIQSTWTNAASGNEFGEMSFLVKTSSGLQTRAKVHSNGVALGPNAGSVFMNAVTIVAPATGSPMLSSFDLVNVPYLKVNKGGNPNSIAAANSNFTGYALNSFDGSVNISATNPSNSINNATTLYINGAPTGTGNMTIINRYGLWSTAGIRTDGNSLISNGSELRFGEPGGNEYTAFKAGVQSANITYTLPTTSPIAGQVLTASASPTDLIWQSINQENTTASNGLYLSGSDVRLGGNLIENTTINNNTFALNIAGSTNTTTFAPNGKVGIGFSTPNYLFQVNDANNIESNFQLTAGTATGTAFTDGLIIATNSTNSYIVNRENTPLFLGSNSINSVAIIDGKVGITNTNPVTNVHLGAIPAGGELAGTNEIPLAQASQVLVTSKNHNGGTTPSGPETVFMLHRAGVPFQSFSQMAAFRMKRYSSLSNASFTQLDISLTNGINDGVLTDVMTLRANGNVGIGNISPNAPLQFSNTITNRKIVLFEAANNDHEFSGLGINSGLLRYQVPSTLNEHAFYAAINPTSSQVLFRILGNGRVRVPQTSILDFDNGIGNRRLVLYEAANNDHQFNGMGINAGVLRFQAASTTNDHVFYAATSATNSNEIMRIKGSGNVELTGQIKISGGSPGLNKVLTSDASGLGSWQTMASLDATTASNGLTKSGVDIQLGGTLSNNTSIFSGGNSFSFLGNSSTTSNYNISNSSNVTGSNALVVSHTGTAQGATSIIVQNTNTNSNNSISNFGINISTTGVLTGLFTSNYGLNANANRAKFNYAVYGAATENSGDLNAGISGLAYIGPSGSVGVIAQITNTSSFYNPGGNHAIYADAQNVGNAGVFLNGRVGIGTTSPGAIFHVFTNDTAVSHLKGGNGFIHLATGQYANLILSRSWDNLNPRDLHLGGTSNLESGIVIKASTGRVGIGTNEPGDNQLQVKRNNSYFGPNYSSILGYRFGGGVAGNGGTGWSESTIDAAVKGSSFYGNNYTAAVAGFNYLDYNNSTGILSADYGGNYAAKLTFRDGAGNIFAGHFTGNVTVTGTLAKGGGTFKIDHPLDPENKYLYHSFVESPDMMNIYNGNITTDQNGFAIVTLPDYFTALNKDFRYQLTVVSNDFAQAIISEKIQNNQFKIRTDKPNIEVSWQVTGIRKDPWANQNRVTPEVDKEPEFKGKYLHPEAYGKPNQMGIYNSHTELAPKK